jgi:hypothetical protein
MRIVAAENQTLQPVGLVEHFARHPFSLAASSSISPLTARTTARWTIASVPVVSTYFRTASANSRNSETGYSRRLPQNDSQPRRARRRPGIGRGGGVLLFPAVVFHAINGAVPWRAAKE